MKINYKNSTLILLIILVLFSLITFIMPSKNRIKEVEVRKIEVKKDELMNLEVYFVDGSKLEKYTLSVKPNSTNDLLRIAVEDSLKKSSVDAELMSMYFGQDIVYFEFSNNSLPEAFVEALKLTTKEITGIENINLLEH